MFFYWNEYKENTDEDLKNILIIWKKQSLKIHSIILEQEAII